jgi:hypothetical protein
MRINKTSPAQGAAALVGTPAEALAKGDSNNANNGPREMRAASVTTLQLKLLQSGESAANLSE